MEYQRHGLSIGMERTGSRIFLSMKVQGKLTHDDYRTIAPMIDSALREVRDPRVRALVDATEMEGWEARAAWDDFRLGLKHGNEFEKVAIHGNRHWQQTLARIGNWFVSGDVRYFDNESEAIAWLDE